MRIKVPKDCSVTFPFDVKNRLTGKAIDLSTLVSCSVKGPGDYTASCAPDPDDVTKRIVIVEGAATATAGLFSACIHWTDAAGKPDAEPFDLEVFDHL